MALPSKPKNDAKVLCVQSLRRAQGLGKMVKARNDARLQFVVLRSASVVQAHFFTSGQGDSLSGKKSLSAGTLLITL